MKKITLEIPESLEEKEVASWVKIKVERHLREIEEAKVPSVDAIIKPAIDEYEEKNGLRVKPIEEVVEKPL